MPISELIAFFERLADKADSVKKEVERNRGK